MQSLKLEQGKSYLLDSGLVDPLSLRITEAVADRDFRFDGDSLYWLASSRSEATLVRYRVLHLDQRYSLKDPKLIQEIYSENPFDYVPPSEREESSYGRLNTYGNISRGVGFGNAQDIVVNSNLNLRLSGLLPNDVEVLAVISDENNPIQPDGNTQQIQDFDQVYITLTKDSTQLTVGDFLMKTPSSSYFMNYYKKSRGLQFNNQTKLSSWTLNSGVEAAISRGRFSRNQIQGIDGNSGPYRLSGTNGELFIIVIAGTEKVYLDGELLIRGEDNDYVVNYNTGEISFTPNVLITRYSRIVVEFQYSDRNYARSVFRAGGSLTKGGFTVYANFFNEMDLKNQPFQQDLDAVDSLSGSSVLELLAAAGDNNPSVSNIRSSNVFSVDRIVYRQIDSMGTKIFVHAQNAEQDSQFYEVSFSFVGQGQGSYVQIQSSANGKVFEYRGEGLGDYAPLSVIIPPTRLNMWNFGFRHQRSNSLSGMELSISDRDYNTFSKIDDQDNRGYGLKLYRKGSKPLKDSIWKFKHSLDYEMVTNGFNFIERYRSVEFNRQWNKVLNNPNVLSTAFESLEHILGGSASLYKSPEHLVGLSLSSFQRPNLYSGINGDLAMAYAWKGTRIKTNLNVLESASQLDSLEEGNQFLSLKALLEQKLMDGILGLVYERQNSQFRRGALDSLVAQSYAFDEIRAYFRTSLKKVDLEMSFDQRLDLLPKEGSYSLATTGRNYSLKSAYQAENGNRWNFVTTYRNLMVNDSSLVQNSLENTLQSRFELDLGLIKRFIRTKTFVQVGTGQEQRREFQYLQIQSGNGNYIWIDYDSNGVQALNEFEIASELDRNRADYIRIYTPVPGFITTRTSKFSESIELNPAALLKRKTALGRTLARFNAVSAVLFEQKSLPQSGELISFGSGLSDSSLINRSSNLRSTLFFNRSNPKFGMDASYKEANSKILLTNGFDQRSNVEQAYNIRWNAFKQWTIRANYRRGNKEYRSEFFGNRDFDYDYWEFKPKLQYQMSNVFRVEFFSGIYGAENDTSLSVGNTQNLEIGSSVKWTQANQGALAAQLSFVQVKFQGEPSSTLGYELLRGLQDGQNATWSLNYQRRIGGSIHMVISYEGRKSQNADVIHIGRLVARYLF